MPKTRRNKKSQFFLKSPSTIFVLPSKSLPIESVKESTIQRNSIFNEIRNDQYHLSDCKPSILDCQDAVNSQPTRNPSIASTKCKKNNNNRCIRKKISSNNLITRSPPKVNECARKSHHSLFTNSGIIRREVKEYACGQVFSQKEAQVNQSKYSICAASSRKTAADESKRGAERTLPIEDDNCEKVCYYPEERLSGGKTTNQWSYLSECCENEEDIKHDQVKDCKVIPVFSGSEREKHRKQWPSLTQASKFSVHHEAKGPLVPSLTVYKDQADAIASLIDLSNDPTSIEKVFCEHSQTSGKCCNVKDVGKNTLLYTLNNFLRKKYKHSIPELNNSHEFLYKITSRTSNKQKMQHSNQIGTDSCSQGGIYLSPNNNCKLTFPLKKSPTKMIAPLPHGATQDSGNCCENFENECSVRVAVRIRPQNAREIIDLCRICTSVIPGEPQIVLGTDKAFTFDYLYNIDAKQSEIYHGCVRELVESALCGYNATVLAYGQTGSGKTYTMGTGFDYEPNDSHQGIIPRTLFHIFSRINDFLDENKGNTRFKMAVRFIELYNEDIIDLLDPHSKGKLCRIHENDLGHITVTGATIMPISNPIEALRYLQQGAVARTTASTQMNHQSSRSHALFTLLIERQTNISMMNDGSNLLSDLETLTSKLHFVDLAGSERLKRTGATGERAREGISINCGLLALGNCISALGDKTKRATHIPYRDSKLTRLLQDSLGGNSRTLMIACVSPSDRDFMETLNTLKYANRARNIKNKVQINQDQTSRTISLLRKEIASLQLELLEFKQGKRIVDGEGRHTLSDTFYENEMLAFDNKHLQQRLKTMNETVKMLTERNTQLQVEKEMHRWSSLVDANQSVKDMITGYIVEIEKLRGKLLELETMYQSAKRSSTAKEHHGRLSATALRTGANTKELIELAKCSLNKQRERERDTTSKCLDSCSKDNSSDLSEESENEWEIQTNNIQEDIDDLDCDIEIKSKLIEQLELSQHRMNQMRQQYEDKLMLLTTKVANTQKERDDILSMIGPGVDNQTNDKMKQIKDEYEKKIINMQREIKKLHQSQREHDRQRQELMAQESKLRNLRTQLHDLKKHKADLIKKLSEQSSKYKREDSKKIREIAQLRKEQQKQENTVRSLQAKVLAKEEILRRKNEEVCNLRRSQRSLRRRGANSTSSAGNGSTGLEKRAGNGGFDVGAARKRWCDVWRAIERAANKRQMIFQFENELDRLIDERTNLTHYMQERLNRSGNSDFDNEEDLIKSNLEYVQHGIDDAQRILMEMEEDNHKEMSHSNREDTDMFDTQVLLSNIQSIEEAKYILDHLSRHTVDVTCKMANMGSHLAEHVTRLRESQQECLVQQQLLQHLIMQQNGPETTTNDLFESLFLNVSEMTGKSDLSDSQHSFKSNETYSICPTFDNKTSPNNERRLESDQMPEHSTDMNTKIRNRTAQVSNMLFGENEKDNDIKQNETERSYTK